MAYGNIVRSDKELKRIENKKYYQKHRDYLIQKSSEYSKSRRRQDPEWRKRRYEYQRAWYNSPAGQKYMKEWRARNRKRRVAHARAWDKRNPDRVMVYNIVKSAVKRGILKKGPCAECGIRGKTEAHHEDYSKPLDVKWLCRRCHRAHDRRSEFAIAP